MGSRRGHSTKRSTLNQTVRKDVDDTNDVIESMRRLDRSMDDVTYTYLGTTLTERLWFEIKKFGRALRRELYYGVWASLKVTQDLHIRSPKWKKPPGMKPGALRVGGNVRGLTVAKRSAQ